VTYRQLKHPLIFEKFTYLLNGILFETHNVLGRYCREKQYGDYIEQKFEDENIKFEREYVVEKTGNIVDFLVDNKIILELKAKRFITKNDYYQTQRYLHATNKMVAIIANFRDLRLKPRRIIKTQK